MNLNVWLASRGWRAEKLNRGWSGDEKFVVWQPGGGRMLLRRAPLSRREEQRRAYEALRQLEGLPVRMSRPLEYFEDEDSAYLLLTWLEGEDAEPALARMSESERYRQGVTAGEYLRQIHSIPAPANQPDWEERYNAKIDRKIRQWDECPIELGECDCLKEYLSAHRALLSGRPQCFQHGDYHVGNLVIDRQNRLGVIDFNRWDYGDPWEEFNRITWCAQVSPAFASGYLNGYFGGVPEEAFFRLLKLYVASNQLSSIPWAIPFGPQEVDVMVRQTREVVAWYDGFREMVPRWYRAHE